MRRGLFTREYVWSVLNLLVLHIGPYLLLSVISVYAWASRVPTPSPVS